MGAIADAFRGGEAEGYFVITEIQPPSPRFLPGNEAGLFPATCSRSPTSRGTASRAPPVQVRILPRVPLSVPSGSTQNMLNKQSVRDKQLLAWDRERQALQKRLRNPPVQPLAEPIQQGWRRSFVLSPEAQLRPDAAVLTAILDEINVVSHHWRRDFIPSRRQLRLSRRTLSSEQFLRAIGINEWDRRSYPDQWHKYFRRELVPHSWLSQPKMEINRYKWVRPGLWQRRSGHVLAFAFIYPHLFVLKTERHWLTHLKQLEPEVVERCEELDNYLAQRHEGRRLDWLYGHSFRYWRRQDSREKTLRRLAEQEMRGALDSAHHVEQPGVADAMPSSPVPRWWHVVDFAWVRRTFAVVRSEILRHQTSRESGMAHRVPALWARVAGPDVMWQWETGAPSIHPHVSSAQFRMRRGASSRAKDVGCQSRLSKRTGSAPVDFLRKKAA